MAEPGPQFAQLQGVASFGLIEVVDRGLLLDRHADQVDPPLHACLATRLTTSPWGGSIKAITIIAPLR